MKMRLTLPRSFWTAALPMVLLVATSACQRDDATVRVQTVPKQPAIVPEPSAPMAMQAQMPPGMSKPAAGGGAIEWTVPDGWKELPGDGLRFATIQVLPDHPEIMLTVIPLSGESGGLIAN